MRWNPSSKGSSFVTTPPSKRFHNTPDSPASIVTAVFNNKNIDIEIIKYLESTPSKEELKHILTLLNFKPIDLIRKNESIWKSEYKDQDLSDDEILDAMISNPKLIERPIVIKGNKAVIGRPPENVLDLL